MGFSLEQRNSSKEQNKFSIEDNVVQPQTSRRTRHIEKAKVRTGAGLKQNDMHQKARQDAGDGASGQDKFSGYRYRESMEGNNAGKVDELVKHMSNLPGYLQRPERGEKIQEKVLNVGVLDWGRLEKWKHKQKPFPIKGSGSSSSERITGKSTSSVVVRNGTNAEELSLGCSSLKSSQKDGLSQGVKPSVHKDVRFQDSKTASKNAVYGQKKISFPYRSLGRNHSDMMLDKGKAKDSDQKFTSETGNMAANLKSYGVSLDQKHEVSTRDGRAKKTKDLQESDIKRKDIDQGIMTEKGVPSSKLKSFDVSLISEGKTLDCHGTTEKRVEELHNSDTNLAHQHCPSAENPVVVSPPKELPQNDFPEVLQLSKPRASWDECMAEADKISFSGNFLTKEMDFAEFSSEVSHSCPLPSAVETNTVSNMLLNSTINGNSVGLSFVPSHMRRCSTQDLLYDDKFVHKKKSEKMLTRSSFDTSSTLDQEDVELATRKGRSLSLTPIRRFNLSLGRLGRSLSFKEISDIPQLSSTYLTVKSGPVRSGTSDCPDNPNREKASTHNRARSSPLRRLLDPILKHKEANLHHSAEAVRPPKSNFNSLVPKPINISESLENLKAEASWVKAFLQITIKNGLPLFKFWVDNNRNCFAATMKNLSSGKDDFCQYFTLYCINEVKRKSGGWMSQGSKGKSCRYAYNVVAQMKVSSSDLSDVNGQDLSKYMVREAVLLDVDLTQADQESPSVVPHRELAAAVVKLPRKDLSHSEQQSGEEVMEKGCAKGSSEDYSWEDSAIVILPGGVHSSPNTGEPSPLLDRWKSGGLCDCGGWDVGCKLRVLSNQNKCCQIPKTSSACYPFLETFELFAEEGAQQNRPIFSLTPGKDRSYSVEFNTSLSLLQAFFICVVVISSCRPSDLSEVSKVSEAKEFQEPNLNQSNGIQVTGPAKYAPNPPMSPVGRV